MKYAILTAQLDGEITKSEKLPVWLANWLVRLLKRFGATVHVTLGEDT